MNLYHNAQMEQTYEITDHTISKKAIIKDDNKNVILQMGNKMTQSVRVCKIIINLRSVKAI